MGKPLKVSTFARSGTGRFGAGRWCSFWDPGLEFTDLTIEEKREKSLKEVMTRSTLASPASTGALFLTCLLGSGSGQSGSPPEGLGGSQIVGHFGPTAHSTWPRMQKRESVTLADGAAWDDEDDDGEDTEEDESGYGVSDSLWAGHERAWTEHQEQVSQPLHIHGSEQATSGGGLWGPVMGKAGHWSLENQDAYAASGSLSGNSRPHRVSASPAPNAGTNNTVTIAKPGRSGKLYSSLKNLFHRVLENDLLQPIKNVILNPRSDSARREWGRHWRYWKGFVELVGSLTGFNEAGGRVGQKVGKAGTWTEKLLHGITDVERRATEATP